jgi:protein SCO1/2
MPRRGPRGSRALLIAAVVAVCGATGVLAAAFVRDPKEPRATPQSAVFRGPVLPPAFRPPPFSLRDQDGRLVSLGAYRGRVVLVTFMHAGCRETCPIMTQQIRGALDDLGADVPVLAVSVSPVEDTPALARRFIARQRMTGRMRFLVGTEAELRPVWKAWGIQPEAGALHHSAFVFLVDRRGHGRVGFPAAYLTPEALAHDLRRLGVARRA